MGNEQVRDADARGRKNRKDARSAAGASGSTYSNREVAEALHAIFRDPHAFPPFRREYAARCRASDADRDAASDGRRAGILPEAIQSDGGSAGRAVR